MGNTLHIHKKHIIEYGECGLNWQIVETSRLLRDKGCCVYGTLNDDCVGEWEINATEFKDAVKKIKEMSADELRKYYPYYMRTSSNDELKKYIIELFETFIETGDKSTDYYHFSWF